MSDYVQINKKLKKIMFITDDYDDETWEMNKEGCEHGEYFNPSSKYANWLTFDFHRTEDFNLKGLDKFDAILIDYGLVGNDGNMRLLERLYKKGVPLAWTGGLGGGWVRDDLKNKFPDFLFAQGMLSASIGRDETLVLLYEVFKDEKPKPFTCTNKKVYDENGVIDCDRDCVRNNGHWLVCGYLKQEMLG